jgi:hypothetical protein
MIAYMIHCHNQFQQAARLLDWIYAPENLYIISIDATATSPVARSAFPERPNIVIKDDLPGIWGGASLVAATLQAMRSALTHSGAWRYFINLSGADLPLKSQSEMLDLLDGKWKEGHRSFVTEYGTRAYRRASVHVDGTISETNEIPFRAVRFSIAGQARSVFQSVKQGPITIARLRPILHVSERFGPKILYIRPLYEEEDRARAEFFRTTPYGVGRQWLIADREFCEIVSRTALGSQVFDLLKSTFIPDECYFQIASRHAGIPNVSRRDNLRFRLGAPVALNDTFLPALKESPALFARKLIEGNCPGLIEWASRNAAARRQI